MRSTVRVLVIACLAAAVLVPAATAADRMWVGFQDDPMFRWDPQRMEAMDRARGNDARIVRTVVDWSQVAPDRPSSAIDPFDPAYKFEDIDELVRNAQQRGMEVLITLWGTPKWANGGQSPQVAPPEHEPTSRTSPGRSRRGTPAGSRATRTSGSSRSGTSPTSRRSCARSSTTRAGSSRRGTYARLAKAGYTGIKQGNRSALVAIGETSSHGRDHPKKGLTDTVAPATFMKGVASQGEEAPPDVRRLGAPPVPVPCRAEADAARPLPERHVDDDAAVRERISTRRSAARTSPSGSRSTATRRSRASRPASPRRSRPCTCRQAINMARKDARVGMFVWFVMQDSNGSLWQSGIYRQDGTPKRAQPRFAPAARPLDPTNGKVTVKGGTKNPLLTVYLREYCANNATGTTVGFTVRGYQGTKLVSVGQGAAPLGIDCTVKVRAVGLTVAKKKTYRVQVAANTATTAEIVRTITVVGA